ncbi:DMT family transporter [Halostella sp. PRR32]|uniref:DMT family transporter n=1 Tax=Halostella sp. PRR32 TaxID=3098147 RepID=UPI002B1E5423|nr:DMT family transporter [Halostella sp. PRR32]
MNIYEFRNVGAFIALAVVWGSSFVAIEVGLASLPPVLFAAMRYDIAALVVLAYAAYSADRWIPRTASEWKLVSVGGTLVIGLHFALLFIGQQYVTSAIAAIVLSLTPVVTPLFAYLLLPGEKLSRTGFVGVLLGLLGVAIVAQPTPSTLNGQLVGVGILFLAAVSFALGSVLTRRFTVALPAVPTQAWMMGIGAGILHGISALSGESFADATWTPTVVAGLLYLAVVAGAGGLMIYFDLLERLGPNETSLVNYVTPAIAAVVGWFALGETINAATIAGFGVIVCGFAAMKRGSIRRIVSKSDSTPRRSSGGTGTVVVDGNAYLKDAE